MIRSLVIGDGLIGSALAEYLISTGAEVYRTTRREPLARSMLRLNLTDESQIEELLGDLKPLFNKGQITVFLTAAVTSYDRCEKDPIESRRINVTNSCLLVERLISQGAFVVLLSSSAVFSGDRFAAEDSECDPQSVYGRQKADAERSILKAMSACSSSGGVAIVRLSKVLTLKTPIISQWRSSLKFGKAIEPFSDLRVSPISLSYAVKGLVAIGAARERGIFHLSGEADVVYADIARELASRWGYSSRLINPVPCEQLTLNSFASPRIASLSMSVTTNTFGLRPQSFKNLISELTES